MERYRIGQSPPVLPQGLCDLMRGVETATIGHIECLGFLSGSIRPVFPATAIGRAITIAAPGRDGTVIYKAIDLITSGDIVVISRIDKDDIACVGGGVATAAKARGAAAIILDGPCTDAEEIAEVGLPVWCCGVSAKTTNRTTSIGGAINVPISCGGAPVLPGHAILADTSGIFVAEPEHMRDLCEAAHQRQARSWHLRPHLAAGLSIFDFNPEGQS